MKYSSRIALRFISVLLTTLPLYHSTTSFPADIYLQIQRGQKVNVALPEFNPKETTDQNKLAARQLRDTAKDDILFTRLFNLTESGPPVGQGKIDFEGWGKTGADLLITGTVSLSKDAGKKDEILVTMVASVYEAPGGKAIFQKLYRTPARNAPRLAHEFVADFIYRFTGNRGVSSSRIVFSNDATGAKEIYVIDYDGKNLRRLTSDKSLAILPRWSPSKKEILYTSYKNSNPDLALYSFETGTSRMISTRRGLNASASFSPDGKTIVATLSYQGSPNLYLLDRQGNILRRLTKSKSLDTSGSFSADGKKIVFASDRPGMPQIYMMDVDGSSPERLTDSGWCDSPVWSPLGDKIAYSKGDGKGHHDIIIQEVANGQIVPVTSESGKNENPTFSPDGRFVAFTSTRNGKREIHIASLDGTIQKKLADIPGSCFTPAWEP